MWSDIEHNRFRSVFKDQLETEVTPKSLPRQEGQDFVPKPTKRDEYKNWGSPMECKLYSRTRDEKRIPRPLVGICGDGVLVVPRSHRPKEGAQLSMTALKLAGKRQYSSTSKNQSAVTESEPKLKIVPTYKQL